MSYSSHRTQLLETKARVWAAIVLLVIILCVSLSGGIFIYVRHIETAPHEMPLNKLSTVVMKSGTRVMLDGCSLVGSSTADLTVRSVSLSPRMTFTAGTNSPADINVLVTNAPADSTHITGAVKIDSGTSPNAVRLRVDMTGKPRQDVELKPVHQQHDPFSFFAFGDNEMNHDILGMIFDDANKAKPLFLLNLGDSCIQGTRKELEIHQAMASSLTVPYFMTLGNHDVSHPGLSSDAWTKLFGPTYYDFEYGNSHFIVLDDATSYISRNQFKWLRNTLHNGKKYLHTFIFAHQPPFDPRPGRYHCIKPFAGGAGTLMGLLKRDNVDVFFSGHIHEYFEQDRDGVKYIISGGASTEPKIGPHYLVVTVNGPSVTTEIKRMNVSDT